ncbi:hypothetical protein [Nitrobacter sp. JJSN]|uniref:hypothetical protein n=1 Tax=Nitrobacter sp. JJSN TaxID=3453033 RepID=UPI003F75886C
MRKKYFVIAAREKSSTHRWNMSGSQSFFLARRYFFPQSGAPAMQRRHPNHERLMEEARRLREEAANIPDGTARHLLLQQAFRAETAVNVDRWLSSPGWQPPK